jgi:hypothetical protein
MAINWLKKKKEVVDFRPRDSDMPIPAKMRERLMAGKASIIDNSNTSNSSSSSSNSSSSGGFFSFFGGGSSSESNSNANNFNAPISEAKTDFWGNPISSGEGSSSSSNNSFSSSTSSNQNFDKLESSLNDVIYRLSRLTDRFELIEKKIERVERKLGIGLEI